MLGVRLPEDLERRLNAIATQTKRPKSYFVKEALTDFLDEYESVYTAVAQYRKDKAAGTLKTFTLDELKKRHGITDADLEAVDLDNI